MNWLLLEAYHGGSHRHLIDGLVARVVPGATVWTLPARKWKWRMRGAALDFVARFGDDAPDAIFASSMTNVGDLRALLPAGRRDVPIVVYFHENQLTYPVQEVDPRDHHFAWTNVVTALAADRVLWNSAYNRDSFLDALSDLLRKMPDARPTWTLDTIAARAEVLPVPIDDAAIAADAAGIERSGPCHIVWNHRWEHDKGPERLLEAVRALVARDVDFRLSVVGQRFAATDAAMDAIRAAAGPRIDTWGFVEDRAAYHRLLARADVALSTARHEFQGLAVLEAAAAGAVPLVPDALAYPEIWPEAWRYADDRALVTALVDRIERLPTWRAVDPRPRAQAYGWTALQPRWEGLFRSTFA